MRSPRIQKRSTFLILALSVSLGLALTSSAFGASAASNAGTLADSLSRLASGFYSAEPTVQEILDGLGWNLSAVTDEVPLSSLCTNAGPIRVRILAEYTGLANGARFLWYPVGVRNDTTEIFPGIASVDDSLVFQLGHVTDLAWVYTPQAGVLWYSETPFNYDQRRHVKVYPGPQPGVYALFWEDLAWLADGDFNDMVVLIRTSSDAVDVAAQPSLADTTFSPGMTVCVDINVALNECDPQPATLSMIEGLGAFTPQTDSAAFAATYCFQPPAEGVYTFVFEAVTPAGDTARDTVDVVLAASRTGTANEVEIAVPRSNAISICHPETVCVPFSVTALCDLTTLRTGAGAHINVTDSALCVYVTETIEFCVPLIAEDACGNYDSVDVCFIVEAFTPTTVDIPDTVDTVLCFPGFVCIPVAVSGGTPPILVTAVPPAAYTGGSTCLYVEQSGVYDVMTIVDNADCPPDTVHTTVTVQINQPPRVEGFPDTMITVCRDGQFCFGPITCIDDDGNLKACVLWEGPGTLNGDTWCYIPPREEIVTVVVRAEDFCNKAALDTLRVRFVNPSAPAISFGNSTFDLCEPGEVCVPFSISNAGQLPLTLSLVGPGSLNALDSLICVPVSSNGATNLTLTATDPCGGGTSAPLTVIATINEAPSISCSGPSASFFCAGDQICFSYVVADPGDVPASVSISGFGSVQQHIPEPDVLTDICFSISSAGPYAVEFIATDACGAADTCTVEGTIVLNQAPTVSLSDSAVFLCAPAEICLPVSCADPDGNLESCVVTGPPGGSYDGQSFCFVPDTAGAYRVTATATDSCGRTSTATRYVTVSYNTAPAVTVAGSLTRDAQPGDTICFTYSTSDADDNIQSVSVLDNALSHDGNQVCIEAVALSVVCARIVVTDACGAADTVTTCVSAGPGPNPQPKPQLPDTVVVQACTPGDVCVPFTVDETMCDPQVLSGVNGGTIDYGIPAVCLFVEAPGIYETGVIAADTCGAETGMVVIIVEPTSPPTLQCPPPSAYSTCQDTTICIVIPVSDPDNDVAGAVATYGTASVQQGNSIELCIPVDTGGTYTSRLIVSDSCGQADTCDVSVTIDGNQPPVVTAPSPGAMTICNGEQICLPVTCTDPDDNLAACGPLDPGGATWDGETLCFTPAVAGLYQWVFRALDACGAEAQDTLKVEIVFNTAPVVDAESDVRVKLCQPDSVCHPFTVTDAENNIASITTTVGIIRDNSVCVYLAGFTCFTITVTDSCGLQSNQNVCLTLDATAEPEIATPDALYRRMCGPAEICFDVWLGPDSSDWIIDVGPVGSFDMASGTVCFTPDTVGTYTLEITAQSGCGALAFDTTVIVIEFNTPPLIGGPSLVAVTQCDADSACFGGVSFSDPDGNILLMVVDSGNAILNPTSGEICFLPDTAGTYCFRVRAEDSCGLSTTKTICAVVTANIPPTVEIEALEQNIIYSGPTQICFDIVADDDNVNQAINLRKIKGAGTFGIRTGTTAILATHCFTADTSGCYEFIFEVTDACGAKTQATMSVCLTIEPPDTTFEFCLDTINSLNGREATVKLRAKQVMPMGGFDFLICFDPTALTLIDAFPDSALDNWEYFTYRVGDAASCPPCVEGQIRLTGIADMDNGITPPESVFLPRGPLAGITFFVTTDRLFIGQCIPVQFCSFDCGDNTVSHRFGDTLFVGSDGVPDTCLIGKARPVLRRLNFCEGRVCIVPPPDDRGDMNLNGIPNEVGDAVFYSRFFIYGDVVFDPIHRESQILASDVNCDGIVLTVADLVYMIRIITGDEIGIDCPDIGAGGKIVPAAYAGRIALERRNDRVEVWLETDRDVGGVYVRLAASGRQQAQIEWGEQTSSLKRDVRQSGRDLRVLLQTRQSGAHLPGGYQKLFSFPIDGQVDWQLVESQAATSYAEAIELELVSKGAAVPGSFALLPNYPNPFNAGTQIRFALGAPSDWTLTVYNVLGQTVDEFEGSSEAGEVSIHWNAKALDGNPLASGIYFARLKAGEYSATRQMVLLK